MPQPADPPPPVNPADKKESKDRTGWKGVMDEFRPSIFTVQLAVSGVMMGFSITQIVLGKETNIYLPLLTSIVGYWLPAPRSKSSEREVAEIYDAKSKDDAFDKRINELASMMEKGMNAQNKRQT